MRANDLADRLDTEADLIERRARGIGAHVPDSVALDRAAAVLLREQAEQLDIQTALATNYAGKAVEYKQEKERAEEQLDTLRNAIEWHRDETKCCDECAAALTADAVTPDGRLWAAAGGGVPEEGATDE